MLALNSIVTVTYTDDLDPLWTGTLGDFLANNADDLDLPAAEIRATLARNGAARFGGGAMPVFTLRLSRAPVSAPWACA